MSFNAKRLVFAVMFVIVVFASLYADNLLVAEDKEIQYSSAESTTLALEKIQPVRTEWVTKPILPIPTEVIVNTNKARLGKKLFYEQNISRSKTTSCASCHNPSHGGGDGRRKSVLADGSLAQFNAPTVFNCSLNFRQFWDGRAATLEDQVRLMITSPLAMGLGWDDVIARLQTNTEYSAEFNQIYADGITANNVANAIAEFERSLITPNAPFDRYLRGERNAISKNEERGYHLFLRYGCVSCHQGVAVGGNMYGKIGAIRDYFTDPQTVKHEDLGRFNLTQKEKHRYQFKVSSLRNVAKTAPYMHDGSVATLEEAVQVMGYYNLGVDIPKPDAELITAFLKTLTGEYQGHPL